MKSQPTALTRLIVEHSPSAVAMFDNKMRYVCHSQNWLQHLGLGQSSIVGLCHYDLFPELPERWRKVHERCLAGETIRSDEDVFLRYDGKTEWVRWEVTPYYEKNCIKGIIIFSEVITQRVLSERELKSSLEWLDFLNKASLRLWKIPDIQHGIDEILKTAFSLSQTQQGYIQLLNKRNNILYIKGHQGFNHKFLSLCGELKTTANTLCALSYRTKGPVILDDIEQEPDYAEHMELVRQNNFRSVQSIPLLNREGFPMAIISVHSPDPGHFTPEINQRMQLYVHYAEAFLERKKYQTELKNLNSRLEKRVKARTRDLADALEREKESANLKSRFFSMASHEFRTPLSIIVSSANLASRYAEKGNLEDHKKHIERITSSAKNLTKLLDDSLNADKIENGIIAPLQGVFNAKETIHNVVFELNGICKKNQKIHCTYKGDEVIVTDEKILVNILVNLISNAIKYSENAINIEVKTAANKIHIGVTDSGIGIPKAEQQFLFSRFFRASNTSGIQGVGLGLHSVHHYTKMLGGKVKINSQPGVGTSVKIKIPISA